MEGESPREAKPKRARTNEERRRSSTFGLTGERENP
jgi:hypothetical protein